MLQFDNIMCRLANWTGKLRQDRADTYIKQGYKLFVNGFPFHPLKKTSHRMWGHLVEMSRMHLGGYGIGQLTEGYLLFNLFTFFLNCAQF